MCIPTASKCKSKSFSMQANDRLASIQFFFNAMVRRDRLQPLLWVPRHLAVPCRDYASLRLKSLCRAYRIGEDMADAPAVRAVVM